MSPEEIIDKVHDALEETTKYLQEEYDQRISDIERRQVEIIELLELLFIRGI